MIVAEIQSSLLEILILIHFHIKTVGVQGFIFVKITFEKYTSWYKNDNGHFSEFAYFSCYLQTKTFAWNRDCIIS